MKKLPRILFIFATILLVASCKKDETTWEKYKDWREANEKFFNAKLQEVDQKGNPIYARVSPMWDIGSYILMKRIKSGPDKSKKPLYTSTVDVIYKGRLYNGTAFDSTYLNTDSIATFKSSSAILGFSIALTDIAIGDSCEVIIPSNLGYGEQEQSKINPYSVLIFGMKLKGIPRYE